MSCDDRENQVLQLAGGGRVGLAVYGAQNGLPVLALHGTPASRFMFKVADEAAFKLGLTLYCPERPGYGLSGPVQDWRAPNGLSLAVDDLVQVVDKLGFKRFIVLGVSGGAPFAVSLACRLGARVRVLGLVSPMGPIADLPDNVASRISKFHRLLFETSVRWPLLLRGAGFVGGWTFRMAPKLFVKFFAWTLGRTDREVLSQAFAKYGMVLMTGEAVRQGLSGALADLFVFSKPWHVDFNALQACSVLWMGGDDRLVPVEASRWLGAQLPGCEVISFKGAGHFWIFDKIEDVLSRVARLAQE